MRQPICAEGALWNDGTHLRRMWMMNNSVVALRRTIDPTSKLSAPRREGADTVIDVVLKEGDNLTVGVAADGLPRFVRWRSWHANPEANFTYFGGSVAWDGQGGVLMPLGYDTRLDWRNVGYFKMYIDGYKSNTAIANLPAPASVASTLVSAWNAMHPLTSVNIARGIWRINNGTTVVELKDHLVWFEFGVKPDAAKLVLVYARNLAPGKPIGYPVSHNHADHTAGLRQAVAENITIIQRASTLQQVKKFANHKAPDFPDDLARHPMPFHSIETQTLDPYCGRNNGHMAEVVSGYVPAANLIMGCDMVTAAYDYVHWPDTLRDVIAHYKLDVITISPVHSIPQIAPDVLTLKQAEQLLSGGVKHASEHSAEQLTKDNYWPGCPIQTKYY